MTRIPYKWIVASVFVCAAFMDIMDTTIVNVALPTLAREFQASTAAIEWVVLGYLLSLADLDPGVGLHRRPHRHEEGVPLRPGHLHDRVGTVRAGPDSRRARRVPGPAGRRRRDARAGRHGHAVPRLPAHRAGAGVHDPHHPDRPRARPRPHHRRLAGHRRVVAVDLLREPAGRDLRLRGRVALPEGAPRTEGGPLRRRRFHPLGDGTRLGPVRALRGTGEGVDVARDPRHRRRRAPPLRAAGLRRDAHPRTDARAPPLQGAHVPQRQLRPRADLRQLRRRPLPPAALPAGAAGAVRAAVGPHDVPAGDRRDDLEPARRAAVPPRRAAAPDRRAGCSAWRS